MLPTLADLHRRPRGLSAQPDRRRQLRPPPFDRGPRGDAPRPVGRPLTGPDGTVSTLAFSPDSRTLAVGGWDDRVHLWDVSDAARTVAAIGTPLVAHDSVASVAFVPDGSVLASADESGTVVLWSLDALTTSREGAVAVACAATGGGLDETEWANLVPGLAYEPTCTDADRDPLGVPAPSEVHRFRESGASD